MSFTITQNLTDRLWIGGALLAFLHLSDWVQRFSLGNNRTYDFTQNSLHFISYSWHCFKQYLMMSDETLLQVHSSIPYFWLSVSLTVISVSVLSFQALLFAKSMVSPQQHCISAYKHYMAKSMWTSHPYVPVAHLILKPRLLKCW